MKHLCEKTSQDRKTVLAHINALERRGYLIDTGQRKGVTKQVKIYQLRVPETGLLNSTENGTVLRERVPFFPGKGTVFPTKESQKRDTESSRTVIEPHEEVIHRLKSMIAAFEKHGQKAKAAKYRAELEMLEATNTKGASNGYQDDRESKR